MVIRVQRGKRRWNNGLLLLHIWNSRLGESGAGEEMGEEVETGRRADEGNEVLARDERAVRVGRRRPVESPARRREHVVRVVVADGCAEGGARREDGGELQLETEHLASTPATALPAVALYLVHLSHADISGDSRARV